MANNKPSVFWDNSKEPFLRNTDPEPYHQPVSYDHAGSVSYGVGDITTRANIQKLKEEEHHGGTPCSGQEDGASRYKNLPNGYQLRQLPPHYLWTVRKDGLPILGVFTELALAEAAAQHHMIMHKE